MIYTKTEKTGQCEYKVWSKELKRMVPCGKPGHYWRGAGLTRASHCLCQEHGEFFADAKSEIQEEK